MKNILWMTAICLLAVGAAFAEDSPLIVKAKEYRALKDSGQDTAAFAYLSSDCHIWYEKIEGEGIKADIGGPWSHWDNYFRGTRQYESWTVDSNAVTVSMMETNDFYKLIEREPTRVFITWWFDDDQKINRVFVKGDRSVRPKDRMPEFVKWALGTMPAEVEYLLPDKKLNPTGDRPERWKKALLEWRKAEGLPEVKM